MPICDLLSSLIFVVVCFSDHLFLVRERTSAVLLLYSVNTATLRSMGSCRSISYLLLIDVSAHRCFADSTDRRESPNSSESTTTTVVTYRLLRTDEENDSSCMISRVAGTCNISPVIFWANHNLNKTHLLVHRQYILVYMIDPSASLPQAVTISRGER